MDIELIFQIGGMLGLITLLYICFMLSRPRHQVKFFVVGQPVFRWMALVLISFIATRILSFTQVLDVDIIRNINSIVFIAAVGGIVWSVLRHESGNGRSSKR